MVSNVLEWEREKKRERGRGSKKKIYCNEAMSQKWERRVDIAFVGKEDKMRFWEESHLFPSETHKRTCLAAKNV